MVEMISGRPPFSNKNTKKLFKQIISQEPDLTLPVFTDDSRDLISKLMSKKVDKRL
jgi:serine/threonine protein kinase